MLQGLVSILSRTNDRFGRARRIGRRVPSIRSCKPGVNVGTSRYRHRILRDARPKWMPDRRSPNDETLCGG